MHVAIYVAIAENGVIGRDCFCCGASSLAQLELMRHRSLIAWKLMAFTQAYNC